VFGNNIPILRRDMVGRSAKKVYDQVKASAAPNTPIIWSEYNATYLSQQDVTDGPFMGPWLANNIRECDGLTDMMSYWSFSDVFEEQGVVKMPFYGGYGLIAERNIPKAAFRAFELLHKLGERRILTGSDDALVTQRQDGTTVIALWNYQEPDEKGAPKTFQLDVKGAKPKGYRLQSVGPGNGSALDAWRKMGSPALPSKRQIQELVRASEMQPGQRLAPGQAITVPPQTLALVEVQR
jgi:xylan 1,4-beta-xylosidase